MFLNAISGNQGTPHIRRDSGDASRRLNINGEGNAVDGVPTSVVPQHVLSHPPPGGFPPTSGGPQHLQPHPSQQGVFPPPHHPESGFQHLQHQHQQPQQFGQNQVGVCYPMTGMTAEQWTWLTDFLQTSFTQVRNQMVAMQTTIDQLEQNSRTNSVRENVKYCFI